MGLIGQYYKIAIEFKVTICTAPFLLNFLLPNEIDGFLQIPTSSVAIHGVSPSLTLFTWHLYAIYLSCEYLQVAIYNSFFLSQHTARASCQQHDLCTLIHDHEALNLNKINAQITRSCQQCIVQKNYSRPMLYKLFFVK